MRPAYLGIDGGSSSVRLCLVTPFRPNAPWSPAAEAGRAAVADALAERTVTLSARAPTLLDDVPPDDAPP